MTRFILLMSAALIVSGCGNADSDTVNDSSASMTDGDGAVMAEADAYDAEGRVLITVERIMPEPTACLLMMSVVNGTDETVTAGLFAFDVTGNGETAGANMFPQTTDAGDVKTAQIILQGADCDNAKIIRGGQINCRIVDTGDSCTDVTELRNGIIDFEQDG